jgi:hypothetical protein
LIIELILDQNCMTTGILTRLKERLHRDLPGCLIGVTAYPSDAGRLKALGVRIVPAWLINGRPARVDPFDYLSVLRAVRQAETS